MLNRSAIRMSLPPVILGLVLAGCGGDPQQQASDGGADEPAAEGGEAGGEGGDDGFCAAFAEVQQYFGVIDDGMTADAQETADAVAAARSRLEATEPPAEVADAWGDITAFYVAVDDAFAEAEITDGAITLDVLGQAAVDTIPATVDPALSGIGAAEAYSADHCSDNGAAPSEAQPSSLCDAVPEAELAEVFAEEIPEPRDASLGPDAQECIWETGDGPAVSVMLLAAADFESQILDVSGEPRYTVDGLGSGEVHKGMFGVGRFDTTGSSVYFTVADRGGTANVRTGEGDDFATDDPIAIAIARAVAASVS